MNLSNKAMAGTLQMMFFGCAMLGCALADDPQDSEAGDSSGGSVDQETGDMSAHDELLDVSVEAPIEECGSDDECLLDGTCKTDCCSTDSQCSVLGSDLRCLLGCCITPEDATDLIGGFDNEHIRDEHMRCCDCGAGRPGPFASCVNGLWNCRYGGAMSAASCAQWQYMWCVDPAEK